MLIMEVKTQMKELAEFFFDQCVGEHAGHQGGIPNNPLMKSIFYACGVETPTWSNRNAAKKEFVKALKEFSRALEIEKEQGQEQAE